MTVYTRDDWKLWDEERERFKSRGATGFTEDLKALHIHIMKLQEYAPKDKANWPTTKALRVIDSLQKNYNRFIRLLEQLR